MKKNLMLGLALISALAFVSCKSSESSYRKAYEKAKLQETTQTTPETTTPVETVTPVQTTPTTTTTTTESTERLDVIGSGSLKTYCVVCGSFTNINYAKDRQNDLVNKGYKAQIVQSEKGMYRVIASSFDDRSSAVKSRDQIKKLGGDYSGAWILNRTY